MFLVFVVFFIGTNFIQILLSNQGGGRERDRIITLKSKFSIWHYCYYLVIRQSCSCMELSSATEKKKTEIQKKQSNSISLKNSIPSNLAVPDMNLINDKPRRLSITTIRIDIRKSREQEYKLQEFTEKLNKSEKGSKIRLILRTFSEDDAAMLKLQTQFFKKFCSYITYLEWEISGGFSDVGQAKAIGDIIRSAVQLYSLNLFINNTHFADKGAESLADGLSYLKKLHVLKLNFNNFYSPLTEKGR